MPHVVGPPIVPLPPSADPPPVPQTTWDASQDIPFPPDATPDLVTPDAEAFPYDIWRCWGELRGRTGWAQMPVAADDSQQAVPSAMVKISAAYSKVLVHYRAIRKAAPPVLPHPLSVDTNLKLIRYRDRAEVGLSDDASTWVWHVRGWRLYACVVPVFAVPSGLLVPVPPYSTATRGSLNVPSQQFSQGII
jgi:hypothetical protein